MYFSELLKAIDPLKVCGDSEIEIKGLFCDSRRLEPGGLFFALRGSVADGHGFIETAIRGGAAAVVAENDSAVPAGIPFAKVADSRQAMSKMAALFNGNPTDKIPLVGITGTNGKTTPANRSRRFFKKPAFRRLSWARSAIVSVRRPSPPLIPLPNR